MLLTLVCLGILFVISWPVALVVLLLWPILWLISLPFRLLGLFVAAVFAFLAAILFLPAKLLGWRGKATQ